MRETEIYSGDLAFLNDGSSSEDDIMTAYWLHSDDHAPVWIIGDSKKGTHRVKWNRPLPDGRTLLDPAYSRLLSAMRKVLFELRQSYSININSTRHVRYVEALFMLGDFTVYHKDDYDPEIHAFSKIDRDGLTSLIQLFVEGGADAVRYVIPRLEDKFKSILSNSIEMAYISEHKADIPNLIFVENKWGLINETFNHREILALKSWLYLKGMYYFDPSSSSYASKVRTGSLIRPRIGELIGLSNYTSASPEVASFLRRFEFVEDYDLLELFLRHPLKEYLPANFMSYETAERQKRVMGTISTFRSLIKGLAFLEPSVDGLPAQSELAIDVYQIAKDAEARVGRHTPTIPVPTALYLLNGAIKYYHWYGTALVDFCLQWARTFQNYRTKIKGSDTGRSRYGKLRRAMERAFRLTPQPEDLMPLKISQLSSWYGYQIPRNRNGGHGAPALCRRNLTLEDAMVFLVCAVYILVAMTMARRKTELVNLPIDCIVGTEGAFKLNFELRKANFQETRAETERPMLDYAAEAGKLLQRFAAEWNSIFPDTQTTKLFFFPWRMRKVGRLSERNINDALSKFTDFIEVPLDENGRRWYAETHEFRRFFAKVFFWMFKFGSLGALRWFFGHLYPEDIYDYVRDIVGGTEMTKEEANYTAKAMLEGCEDNGLEQLRRLAVDHFHTADVSLIEEADLRLYLEGLVEQGAYRVRPHGIETSDGIAYEMVFEVFLS